ncbi:CRISPR-associated protein Csx16 [Sphaerotilus uruguayifluvii]|uniref:CRISPR-associated protein Csx16 n=1 Tax=Sphaerotilus uruguayifluvii TaxID=2735897 RepID=A0ABX2G8E4_9BURK|nr:CRISPR-associated protein Csx16 [Leptothrix sp. C29]NRT58011.1 CRISPR-associated protein Csx16 [Leptothrix sp. C29]
MILLPLDPVAAPAPAEGSPLDCVVTRHAGAAEWVQRRLGRPVRVVEHLHPHEIVPGARYHGVFPLNLAAAICRAGAQCWAISMQVPPTLRGQELGADQLDALGARLVRYQVSELPPHQN